MPGSASESRVLQWIVTIVVIAFLAWLLLPAIDSGRRTPAKRTQCRNNLRQISLALQSYHLAFNCFPPAYVADASGRPMHSWRVLILPYLDQVPLYNQYRFDEPWNGPNNSKLAIQRLPVYECPTDVENREGDQPSTSYVAVVGPHTMWPENSCVSVSDVPDGTSLTLHVAEVRNSGIHWMEPRDLHLGQMSPTINPTGGQGVSSFHTDGALASFVEGDIEFLSEKLPPQTVRKLIDRNDGGPTNGEEF
jgi:type II secretory pathway pseudopilin PulG